MKGTKLLLSLWLSTAAFCLLQIVFGPGGMTETARLHEQQDRLEVRLAALKEDNRRLTARYEALRTSEDAVRLEARSLGWFQKGDVPVRVLDGPDLRLPPDEVDLSTVAPLGEENPGTTLFFRLAWPLLFASFYALLYLGERLFGRLPPEAGEPAPPSVPAVRAEAAPAPVWEALRDQKAGLDFFRK